MMQTILIGLGAGAAAALLFATVATGSLLSIVLFYIAPLPIMIAALGWSHIAGLIAALSAGAVLAAIFGWIFLLAFLAGTGLPAWWLGYLTMLARPAGGTATTPQLEWYPSGRLLLWAAGFAALVVILGILNLGLDYEGFRTAFRAALERVIKVNPTSSGRETADAVLDFLVVAIPPAAAVLATITNVLNLWLAGKVVSFSGRLKRPWPDLSSIEFPRSAGVVLIVLVLLNFAGGLIGFIAGIASAALIMAYGLLGFAVLHAITRSIKHRALILSAAYASVLVFGWPIFALCLLGIADQFLNLRARTAQRRGPPAIT